MQFASLERSALPDVVTDRIRSAILAGEVEPGSLLPPERELAVQFGVNRTTIRESLQELELLGLVSRRQGVGCRVLDYHETGSLDLLPYVVIGEDGRFRDEAADSLLELTGVFYGLVVRNAALRATAEDVAEMDRLLSAAEIETEAGRPAAVSNLLLQFYSRLIRSAHSIVLELMANSFQQLFSKEAPSFDSVYSALGARTLSGTRSPHRRLLDAISARDVRRAQELVASLGPVLETIVKERDR